MFVIKWWHIQDIFTFSSLHILHNIKLSIHLSIGAFSLSRWNKLRVYQGVTVPLVCIERDWDNSWSVPHTRGRSRHPRRLKHLTWLAELGFWIVYFGPTLFVRFCTQLNVECRVFWRGLAGICGFLYSQANIKVSFERFVERIISPTPKLAFLKWLQFKSMDVIVPSSHKGCFTVQAHQSHFITF